MSEMNYIPATGKRKTAIAQVRLIPGEGPILINNKPLEEAFPRLEHRYQVLQPFLLTDSLKRFQATIKVVGGGISGQAGAIRHGVAKALALAEPSFKAILRQAGLLTRDPRVKERKKYGLKRARKAPQYTKR
jgi:small subunit ribosomal protein S9